MGRNNLNWKNWKTLVYCSNYIYTSRYHLIMGFLLVATTGWSQKHADTVTGGTERRLFDSVR